MERRRQRTWEKEGFNSKSPINGGGKEERTGTSSSGHHREKANNSKRCHGQEGTSEGIQHTPGKKGKGSLSRT